MSSRGGDQPNCHPALLTPDILPLIFDWLRTKQALSAASRTCTAWKEPALNALWSDVQVQSVLRILAPVNSMGGLVQVQGIVLHQDTMVRLSPWMPVLCAHWYLNLFV